METSGYLQVTWYRKKEENMLRLFRAALLIGVVAGAVQAQAPVITEITSSASEVLPGLPNSPIAAGSIFVIYGLSMGPTSLLQYTGALPLPTTLGAASVSFTGGGVTAAAPLFYVYSGQIAGILPSNIPPGPASVTVSFNGGNGSFPLTVVTSNFSSYTINGSGTGPAVVVDGANNTVVTVTNSAAPGDEVVLYGTGLGPIIGGTDGGVPMQGNLPTTIQVWVGGTLANLAYHGRSGDAGLDQINFFIPAGVNGCANPIIVQSGATIVSNTATIAVAPIRGATCSDSTGLPLSSITTTNGTISLGVVSLTTTTSVTPAFLSLPASTTISAGASASFYQYSAQQLTSGSGFSTPSIGGCVVNLVNLAKTSTSNSTFTGLNAGNPIAVTGPVNLTLNALSGFTGTYTSQNLSSALPQGTYSVTGPGGTQVGAFTTTITVPQSLVWTNQAAIGTTGITRANGQQIAWTGGGSNSYVEITGSSFTSVQGAEAFFICIAPAAAGSFTIPSWVLLSLPASASTGGLPSGSLSVTNYSNPVQISPTPSGLNYAFSLSGSGTFTLVNYQ
jgi:uncharacterized protein (TIGR03437 family)